MNNLKRTFFCNSTTNRTLTALLLSLLSYSIVVVGDLKAQPAVPPPNQIWVSLGYSTIDEEAVDWKWLRTQCMQGRILQRIEPVRAKTGGIIVPVFDNGNCFYSTSVQPFKGGNPNANAGEQSLRSLLLRARQLKIPIYLGLDVLEWEKRASNGKAEQAFGRFSDFTELNVELKKTSLKTNFASPFSSRVLNSMKLLIKEIATKFPDASGIALNFGMSSQEIIGFSEAARAASINDIGVDPVELNLLGVVNENVSGSTRQWIDWRHRRMASFIKSLRDVYKVTSKNKKVLVSGTANYYGKRQILNDLRTAQDWRRWLKAGTVDGVLLEGRWLDRFNDNAELHKLTEKGVAADKLADPSLILPVVNGAHLVQDSNYQKDWSALKSRSETLDRVVLVAKRDADLKQIVALASGSVMLSQVPPKIGEVAPELLLSSTSGKRYESKMWRSKNAMLWILQNETAATLSTSDLQRAAPVLRSRGIEPLILTTRDRIQSHVTQSADTATPETSPPLHLLERTGAITAPDGAESTFITVDKAGFVRDIKSVAPADVNAFLSQLQNPTPNLTIGQAAPDFSFIDMNGKPIRLHDFRGRKNVLLAFFPKCFTGGCQNHLASIRDLMSEFKSAETQVIAVSVDPADIQIDFAERWNLPFPLVPDTGRHLSILYGAATDTEQLAERQSVFIDKAGMVRLIDKHVHVQSHGADVLKAIKDLNLSS